MEIRAPIDSLYNAGYWPRGYWWRLVPQTWKLFTSYDGGITSTLVWTVTARSALVERDSERGLVIVFWEAEANIQHQRSLDGGATWSTAADVLVGGVAVTGELLDCTMDPRRGNVVLAVDAAGVKTVYESLDLGETWTAKLT